MTAIKYPTGAALGQPNVQNFRKIQQEKVKEMIDAINALSTSVSTTTVTTTNLNATSGATAISVGGNLIKKFTLTALNATGTLTAAMVKSGGITSTTAAGVTATLDTATIIATALGATQGTIVDFVVDNTAGASTVTLAVAAGIVVAKQTSNGDTAVDQLLTVAASATVGVGVFRLVFTSATTAVLFRI